MRTEIHILAWSVLLGLTYLLAQVGAATMQRGAAWNRGNRAPSDAPLTGAAFRLDQAFRNFLETFPLFAAAVLTLAFTQKGSTVTEVGAHLYFWARVLYLPIYGKGITGLRSLVWCVSLVGILLVWSGIYFS